MSELPISSRIRFWDEDTKPWRDNDILNVDNQGSTGDQRAILDAILTAYNKPTDLTDIINAYKEDYINISVEFSDKYPAAVRRQEGFDTWIQIDVAQSSDFYKFDHLGRLTSASLTSIVAHEINHLILNTSDPLGYQNGAVPTDEQQNSKTYDYKGEAVKFENTVEIQLQVDPDAVRASYGAVLTANDVRKSVISEGVSYSDGLRVDIVRFGDQSKYGQDNNIVFSERSEKVLAFGFAGIDTMFGGTSGDYLYGGTGGDTINGGGGNDHLFGSDGSESKLVPESVESKKDGKDTIHGNDGDDWIYGGYGPDALYGDEGNDKIYGNQGNDNLFGGAGNDELDGGDSVDRLNGEAGDDLLEGGDGADIMNGGLGNDLISGYLNGYMNAEKVDDGDKDALSGGGGNDFLIGYGSDEYSGGQDNDTIEIENANTLKIDGGSGYDKYQFITTGGYTSVSARVIDSDGSGSISLNGGGLIGGSKYSPPGTTPTTVTDRAGNLYTKDTSSSTLTISLANGLGSIVVENWSQGKLGIYMDRLSGFKPPEREADNTSFGDYGLIADYAIPHPFISRRIDADILMV